MFLLLFLIIPPFQFPISSPGNETLPTTIPRPSEVYTRISITGDDPLDWEPFSNGGAYDGSSGLPYRIVDKQIDASGVAPCIQIASSTVYFIISGCTLENLDPTPVESAIKLYNVQNGRIDDSFSSCDVSGNFEHGIFLFSCSNIEIIGATIHDIDDGNNNGNGIFMENCNDVDIISGNIFSNCAENGIMLNDQCDNNLILGNEIYGNDIGILIDNGEANELSENDIHDNLNVAVLLDQCVGTIISEPIVDFKTDGTEFLIDEPIQFTFMGMVGQEPASFEWDFNNDAVIDSIEEK